MTKISVQMPKYHRHSLRIVPIVEVCCLSLFLLICFLPLHCFLFPSPSTNPGRTVRSSLQFSNISCCVCRHKEVELKKSITHRLLATIGDTDCFSGGRTAWSSRVKVQGRTFGARYWYDGNYVNNAREDAAEVALMVLEREKKMTNTTASTLNQGQIENQTAVTNASTPFQGQLWPWSPMRRY